MRLSISILLIVLCSSCEHITYKQGKDLYKTKCGHCHMEDGSGVGELYPSLNSLGLDYNYENISCIIRNGKNSGDKVIEMIGLKELSEIEITNIVNYLKCDLNHSEGMIPLPQTKELLNDCKPELGQD